MTLTEQISFLEIPYEISTSMAMRKSQGAALLYFFCYKAQLIPIIPPYNPDSTGK